MCTFDIQSPCYNFPLLCLSSFALKNRLSGVLLPLLILLPLLPLPITPPITLEVTLGNTCLSRFSSRICNPLRDGVTYKGKWPVNETQRTRRRLVGGLCAGPPLPAVKRAMLRVLMERHDCIQGATHRGLTSDMICIFMTLKFPLL